MAASRPSSPIRLRNDQPIFSQEISGEAAQGPQHENAYLNNIALGLDKVDALYKDYKVRSKEVAEQEKKNFVEKIDPILRTLVEAKPSLRSTNKKLGEALTNIDQKVNEAVRRLNEDRQVLVQAHGVYSEFIRELGEQKINVAHLSTRNVDKIIQDVINLQEKIETSLEPTSYNGEFIFKISDYEMKKNARQGGEGTYISAPFFTSRSGYKMALQVEIGGLARCGASLVIMRGEYDSIQNWPFSGRITMKLLCPGNPTNAVEFAQNVNPGRAEIAAFQKPRTDKNPPYGPWSFVSEEDVDDPNNGYLTNDAIYVGVSVQPS